MPTVDEIYEAVKNATCKKAYQIETEKSDNLTIFDSKFGGLPYWDLSQEFPKDNQGLQLNLLAQINFDKENLDNDALPKKGLLQFFISTNDDMYGMLYKEPDKQMNFRVVYHENVNYEVTEDEIRNNGIKTFKDVLPKYNAPFTDAYKITFKEIDSVINIGNRNFGPVVSEILKEKFNVIVEPMKVESYLDEIDRDFYRKFSSCGHKLLGYPFFTQSDPRYRQYEKYDTLLLQIDSDGDIMWGDSGIANFFINKDDLKNKDFSNILYNWDCC